VPRAASQFLRELDEGAVTFEDFARRPPSHELLRSGAGPTPEEQPDEDGFVPLHDHLPPEESRARIARRRRRRIADSEAEEDVRIIDAAADAAAPTSPYADWKPGTLVSHERYGVGRVIWIRPGPGQTRAAIHFAARGEKTFILELSPIEKLERG
jgi:hypothetical protein